MASSRTFTLLCALLAATLVGATLSPPAILVLGPKVISERLTQELKKHDAVNILQQLPLLSAMREKPAGGIPIIGNLVNSVLNLIIWLKVTSANILQVQVQPSDNNKELMVTIPLDMVAGFNTPLVKTIVEMHMETEAQATIRVKTNSKDQTTRLVLGSCSNSQGSLRISLLQKLSFLVNPLANNVMKLLVPALPKLVKSQLCPVIEEALEDMHEDLLRLVNVSIPVSFDHLNFDLLSAAIKGNLIQLNLGAKLLDSQKNVKRWFNESAVPLTMPALDSAPFALAIRQDVVNAVMAALIPPEEIMVLLDYVLPELALRLKSNIEVISEKAANQLGHTQIVKILIQESPEVLLDQGNVKVAQLIVLQIFATNEVRRPFFTLGIEASSDAQFHTEGDHLILSLDQVSSDGIHLMNSDIGLFNPELLKDITTEILASVLLPNENGKLRPGILVPMVKALGFKAASWSLTKDAFVITPASE
ncbi:BPI fold containing family B member 1 [Phyllostomus discolor]|uniref:BPI fold-containing family B member 1 n=1 Tax=Phyllostomus discolor TaxID=89673 RepID=A0A6J2MRH7_9CHIR|nr:BPI fold-containing family B member 1 [Phyllostomus discolor]XP_035865617.1 BPI fold-containing family B member 1 [Phyllostomus discolor]KAF6087442.1 BPI fold containing family B member 1 [Phyllostomus discolor]